jgi:serine/threonine-protein kinase
MAQPDGQSPGDRSPQAPQAVAPDAATVVGPEHAADSTRHGSVIGAGQQLVFGILALQNELLSREQLVVAFDTWIRDKSLTLADVLESQGALSSADRQLTERLVARFVEKNSGLVEQGLVSFSALTTVRPDLERLNDGELSISLAHAHRDFSPALEPDLAHSSACRFTILRPHARGGLGQISVAFDQELRREVALKEIQPQHADSATNRERFVVEAEITGRLEHPGIVPVYSMGRGTEGRPFYAMRLIKGESLKQTVDNFHSQQKAAPGDPGTRQIEFRQLLARFIAVCNAVEYAHSRGVLHRDLKPANIMVGAYGETLVVDWGLARPLGAHDGGGDSSQTPAFGSDSSSQTRLGSVIGTPSFMSPEQAAGKVDELNAASDIYGLGATLYYLLTGQPPVIQEGKREILDKVQRGEFPSPRSILPAVPAGLEAICLKAMALTPADRYQTASALADDVEQWLADEPVSALFETFVQRAARWTRRHRAWAQAAAVALVAVTVVSTAAALLVNQSRHQEQLARLAARENELLALRNAEDARRNEMLATTNEAAAREFAESAKQNAERAEENAATARRSEELAKAAALRADQNAQLAKQQYRQTVDIMLGLGVQLEKRLQNTPRTAGGAETKALKSELFNTVGDSLLLLGKTLQSSGVADFAMASAHDRMGELFLKLGRGTEALAEFETGRKLVEQAAAERPADDVARANLALLTMKIGRTHLDVHDDARAALQNFITAGDLQRGIMDHPRGDSYKPADNRRLLSMYEIQAGIAELRLGHPFPARKHFRGALDLRRAWLDEAPGNVMAYSFVSECHLWLGSVAWHLDDAAGTQAGFNEALRIAGELAQRFPKDQSFVRDLAEIHAAFAEALCRSGKFEDARREIALSLEHLHRVIDSNRDDVSSLPLLAQVLEQQALLAERLGESAQAAPTWEQARLVRDRTVDLDQENLSWLAARALTLAHCRHRAEAAAQMDSLLRRTKDSSAAQLQAARCFAICAEGEQQADQKGQFVARALTALAAAVTEDFDDPVLLTGDSELISLRPEPAFQKLVAKLKERRKLPD